METRAWVIWLRRAPAILAMVLLSVPSAIGVFNALEPTRGTIGAGMAAAGFELTYVGLAILLLNKELRDYANRVSLFAVSTAILLNSLADYSYRVPGGLANTDAFLASFDFLALTLALLESIPLAGLAYAIAVLLHRLGEEPGHAPESTSASEQPAPAWAVIHNDAASGPEPVPATTNGHHNGNGVQALDQTWKVTETLVVPPPEQAPEQAREQKPYTCEKCGASLTLGQYGSMRRRGYCRHCKDKDIPEGWKE